MESPNQIKISGAVLLKDRFAQNDIIYLFKKIKLKCEFKINKFIIKRKFEENREIFINSKYYYEFKLKNNFIIISEYLSEYYLTKIKEIIIIGGII